MMISGVFAGHHLFWFGVVVLYCTCIVASRGWRVLLVERERGVEMELILST